MGPVLAYHLLLSALFRRVRRTLMEPRVCPSSSSGHLYAFVSGDVPMTELACSILLACVPVSRFSESTALPEALPLRGRLPALPVVPTVSVGGPVVLSVEVEVHDISALRRCLSAGPLPRLCLIALLSPAATSSLLERAAVLTDPLAVESRFV